MFAFISPYVKCKVVYGCDTRFGHPCASEPPQVRLEAGAPNDKSRRNTFRASRHSPQSGKFKKLRKQNGSGGTEDEDRARHIRLSDCGRHGPNKRSDERIVSLPTDSRDSLVYVTPEGGSPVKNWTVTSTPGPQDFLRSFFRRSDLSLQPVVGPPSNPGSQLRGDGVFETPTKTNLGTSLEKYKALVCALLVVSRLLISDCKNWQKGGHRTSFRAGANRYPSNN